MPDDDIRARSRQALDLWASGADVVASDILDPDYVNHQEPDIHGDVATERLSVYEALLDDYHRAFSESTVKVFMQMAEGDLVTSRWEISATNTGEYLGRPATGVRATWTCIQIDRHDGGRIVESWINWDKFRLLHQLGLVEQP
jgi:predicted ester cyclase